MIFVSGLVASRTMAHALAARSAKQPRRLPDPPRGHRGRDHSPPESRPRPSGSPSASARAIGILEGAGTAAGSAHSPRRSCRSIALLYGWRAAFVVTGALGFVWVAVWASRLSAARREAPAFERAGNEPTDPWVKAVRERVPSARSK